METGFISVRSDNSVYMLNAQGSDRVEVLQGRWTLDNDVDSIDGNSAVFAHDDRMIRSWRNITINGHELSDFMGMATKAGTHGATHLSATLHCRRIGTDMHGDWRPELAKVGYDLVNRVDTLIPGFEDR